MTELAMLATGPLLRGTCNRCGLCCVVQRGGVSYTCDFLVPAGRLGTPQASLCLVYERRVHGMPITLTSRAGHTIVGQCLADGTPSETAAIIARGIGRGCSLEVVA